MSLYHKTAANQQQRLQVPETKKSSSHSDSRSHFHAKQSQFSSWSADPRVGGKQTEKNISSVHASSLRQARHVGSLSKVFTVDTTNSPKYKFIMMYGTTRSMPEQAHLYHEHNDHYVSTSDIPHKITNGHTNAIQRHYASTKRKPLPLSAGSSFKRVELERKEDAITFFYIEMDKSPYFQYRPGEEISGSVHMDIQRNVEVRYVELMIEGHGIISVLKSRQNVPCTLRERYLHKHTFLIGSGDASWSSVLTPGHYMSKFRFCLPRNLPSSMSYDDLSSGFTFNINYFIKIRICDDIGSSSIRSVSSANRLVKVLLTKKQPFRVQRHFDLNLIPLAKEAMEHTEEVNLSCTGNNRVVVMLYLERQVFPAGDDIKLKLAASVPRSQRIRLISCQLQQHIKLDKQQDQTTFTISTIERIDPQSMSQVQGRNSYDVTLPTRTSLVTSFLHGCSIVQFNYTLAIEIRFSPAGGKLSFTIPLEIGPCAEPIYADKISSRKAVPIFNRPKRFPHFSPSGSKGSDGPKNPLKMESCLKSSQSINLVTTKYSNNIWAKCFLCCCSSATID